LDQFRQKAAGNGIDTILAQNLDEIPTLINLHQHRQVTDPKLCIAPVLRDLPWKHSERIWFGNNDGSYAIGVSRAQGAISQTGTLVLVNHPGNPASICFLSKEHIVIVYESEIRATALDIWDRDLGETNAIHFITGPSSTADIVGKFLIGVHGPERVICIIVS
jgi:L-lactate utilization protein LutC